MQTLKLKKLEPTTERRIDVKPLVIAGAAIFALVLFAALMFHFTAEAPKRTLCFDARQYLFDTARITEFILSAINGQWRTDLLSDSQFRTAILADGPAFPSIFGILFAFTGHVPGIQDCKLIEVIQSLMHASSATMVFALAWLLNRRFIPAISAGLLWGLYPAAIFWSGVYYTETTVIFFSLLFTTVLSQSRKLLFALTAGLLGGLVALLKPALLPAAGLASLLSFRLQKKSLLLLILGAVISMAPWALYTKSITGHASITAQRYPAFNLAMGSDTEVDGCLVSPAPPLTTMFSRDNDMPFAFPMAQWQFHTLDCLRLSAVKFSSLWSRQANDFRLKFFGIDPHLQNIWHLLIIFSGITGIISCILNWRLSSWTRAQQTIALCGLIFILSHFCYVLFTPAARYGLTAVPFFILFVSYAIQQAMISTYERKKLIAPAIASSLLVAALLAGAYLSPIFKTTELSHLIRSGDAAIKRIDLSSVKNPSSVYSALVLVDGDDGIENAEIWFNGHKLAQPLKHVRNFDSALYKQSFELRSLGYPSGISTDAFRHWRAVNLPVQWLNWNGDNEIKVVQKKSAAVIYSDPSSTRHMLALNYFSVNSLCNSDTSLDLRVPNPITTGNVRSASYILQASEKKQLHDSLRVKVAIALGKPFSPQKDLDSRAYKQAISSKNFDLYIQDPDIHGIRVNRISMKAARSLGTVVELPEIVKSHLLKVRVTGEIRGTKDGKGEVVVALQPAADSAALVLNMSPDNISYTNKWHEFSIEDIVPTNLLAQNKKHSLYLAAYPGPWLDFAGYVADKHCGDAQFRNIHIEVTPQDGPDIAGKQVLFY